MTECFQKDIFALACFYDADYSTFVCKQRNYFTHHCIYVKSHGTSHRMISVALLCVLIATKMDYFQPQQKYVKHSTE